jgi:ribose/xylose/arabinose/galactoside ABC-type transport system permease subunit
MKTSLLSRLVIASPFASAWIALIGLLLVDAVAFPASVSSGAFSAVLPLAAFLAIASIGQMLVIMTGGIDLSVPGVITMSGTVVLGLSHGSNGSLAGAIVGVLVIAAIVGFVNGVLVSVAKLNPLIVTLSVGGVALGGATAYRTGLAQEANVPGRLATWASGQFLGVSTIFWLALILAALVSLAVRYTVVGRRFLIVGGNPRAARVAGIAVRRYQIAAYTAAGVLYAVAGLLLAGFVRTPTLDVGDPYLLGPIAAVVIAGTSLAGGTASAMATFAAAWFLTQLSQTLRVEGLSSAWQYVVFGAAIAIGMLVSGDRILAVVGTRMLRRPVSVP